MCELVSALGAVIVAVGAVLGAIITIGAVVGAIITIIILEHWMLLMQTLFLHKA